MKTFKIYENTLMQVLSVYVGYKKYTNTNIDEYFSYFYSQEEIVNLFPHKHKYEFKNLSLFSFIIPTIHTMQEEKYKS